MEAIIDKDESFGKPEVTSTTGLVESGLHVIEQGDSLVTKSDFDDGGVNKAVVEVSPQKEESYIKLDDGPEHRQLAKLDEKSIEIDESQMSQAVAD